MTLRVLHEVSMVGQGYFDPQARAGVHRVIVNAMAALQEIPEATQGFGAFASAESALGLELALAREPGLLPGTLVPTRHWHPEARPIAAWAYPRWIHAVKLRARHHPYRMLLAATCRGLAATAQPRTVPGWDIVHAWYHALPPPAVVPGAVRVLTVQDVIPLLHPEWFPAGTDRYLAAIIASASANDWIMCSSQATRDDLLKLHPEFTGRVTVIPYAADDRFNLGARVDAPRVRQRHDLGDRGYLVAVGTLEPRKNLPRLVTAYADAFAGRPDAPLLAIVGSPGWDQTLETALHQARSRVDGIRLLGRVSDDDLPGLLAGAHALVYPSLYEGFGLPPLEAMACGTPVITSNCSSLPEVVGAAALLVDPQKVHSIATALRRLNNEPDLHATLAARSLQQAERFSWARTAQSLTVLYRNLTEHP
jgi:glycosyltransferase involved in cell wall biosynthesis